jgi:hypothetical protein
MDSLFLLTSIFYLFDSVGSSATAQIYQKEIFQLACCVSHVHPETSEQL